MTSNLIDPPPLLAHEPIPGMSKYPCCVYCTADYMCGRREGHAVPCVDGCNDTEGNVA